MKTFFVYILTNQQNGTLYVGVTSDLLKRIREHKNKVVKGFTAEYSVDKLVYYEQTTYVHAALQREKTLKRWARKWKIELIEKENPDWKDLYETLINA